MVDSESQDAGGCLERGSSDGYHFFEDAVERFFGRREVGVQDCVDDCGVFFFIGGGRRCEGKCISGVLFRLLVGLLHRTREYTLSIVTYLHVSEKRLRPLVGGFHSPANRHRSE